MKAFGIAVVCCLLTSFPQSVLSQEITEEASTGEFEAGVHYETLLIPVDTADADRVEVVEVFSYACIHCYNFDGSVESWSSGLGDYVAFRRMPAIFNETWEYLAQAYYTAAALEVLDQMHAPMFEAIHLQGIDLRDTAVLAELFQTEAGVDNETFTKVFNSFGVRSSVQQADAHGRMYRVSGVPAMIVNGKYRVDGRLAGNNTRMLQVVDYLVERERVAAGAESIADAAQ